MHPFDYVRTTDSADAIRSGSRAATKFIAGGTNLVDLMKAGVESPSHIVDVNDLPLATIESVAGGIRIGALARMSDVAAHRDVQQRFPAVSQARRHNCATWRRSAAISCSALAARTSAS